MFDYIATFANIIATSVKGAKKTITMALQGPGTGLQGDTGETSPEEPSWGQVGILARPLPKDANGSAEAIALRLPDGLAPVAHRDNRLTNAVPALEPGQFALCHYAGGYVTVKGLDASNTQTLIQLKTGPCEIKMDPTGLGTVWIGDSNTAQSLVFSEALFEWIELVKRILNNPAVQGVAPSAVLSIPNPLDLVKFNSYATVASSTQPDETQMLKAT